MRDLLRHLAWIAGAVATAFVEHNLHNWWITVGFAVMLIVFAAVEYPDRNE